MRTAIEEFLKLKQFETKTTASRYGVWLRRLAEFAEFARPQDITQEKITSFMLMVKEKYAPKTLEYCSAILHHFARTYNLQWRVKVRPQRANSHKPVSEETHLRILKLCPANEYRYLQRNIIVRILHQSGCRVSECLAIDMNDITEKPWVKVKTAKTIEEGRIFWDNETHRLIVDRYLPIRREMRKDSPALFIGLQNNGEYSNRLSVRTVEKWYEAFSEILGVHCVPHGERHFKAHDILNKGGTVADIQNILRHRSPLSSHKYTGFGGKELEERVAKFL